MIGKIAKILLFASLLVVCSPHRIDAMGRAAGALGKVASAAAKAGAKAARAAAKVAKGGKVSAKAGSSLKLDKLAVEVGAAAAKKGIPYIDDVTDITHDLEKYNEFQFLADLYLYKILPDRNKADQETQELIDSQFVAYFNLYHMKCTKTRAHVDPPAINFIGAMCKERWQYAPFILYGPNQQSPNRDVVYPSFPMGDKFGEPELSDWLTKETLAANPELKVAAQAPQAAAQPQTKPSSQPQAKPSGKPQAKPNDTQPLDKSLSAAQMAAKAGYGLAIKDGELVMSGHVTTPPNLAPTTISNEKVTIQNNDVLIHGFFVDVTGKKIYLVNVPGSNADTNKFVEIVKTILSKLAQGKAATPAATSATPSPIRAGKPAPAQEVIPQEGPEEGPAEGPPAPEEQTPAAQPTTEAPEAEVIPSEAQAPEAEAEQQIQEQSAQQTERPALIEEAQAPESEQPAQQTEQPVPTEEVQAPQTGAEQPEQEQPAADDTAQGQTSDSTSSGE